jgi:hypothetical protein
MNSSKTYVIAGIVVILVAAGVGLAIKSQADKRASDAAKMKADEMMKASPSPSAMMMHASPSPSAMMMHSSPSPTASPDAMKAGN